MTDEQFTKGQLGTLTISSLIGAGFGAGWWFSATSSAPSVSTLLRVVAAVVLVAFIAWAIRLRRSGAELPADEAGRGPFGFVYAVAVLVLVAAIVIGSRLLDGPLRHPDAVAAWVLFAVGLHFVPFSSVFRARKFFLLAGLLCGIAVVAVVLGAAGASWAWRTVPGFGGALALWGTAAAGLIEASKRMRSAVGN